MARKAAAQKPPTIALDRSLRALTQQIDGLQKLRGRQYQEAATDESQWKHQTQSIIGAAFGDPSSGLERFCKAAAPGGFFAVSGSSLAQQLQRNFERRISEFDALLRSLIEVLRLQLPEEEIKGVYEPGDQYAFYRDLSSLVATVTTEIFIVDAYLDEQIFNLYVDKVPATATVRILSSNKIGTNVQTVAKMYAKRRLSNCDPAQTCMTARCSLISAAGLRGSR